MGETCCFRQVEEKHVSSQVTLMEWSPRMDLLVLANAQGEVVLHRLSWQKVWSVASQGDDVMVTTLSWRPDGKVIAVGYSSGVVLLCDVENASVLHTIRVGPAVTASVWVSRQAASHGTSKPFFQETAPTFLPKLPQFPKSYSSLGKGQSEESVEDCKKLKGQTDVNLLVLGSADGHAYLYTYGIFPCGDIDVHYHGGGHIGEGATILSGHLSSDLCMLSLVVQTPSADGDMADVCLVSIATPVLASKHEELHTLAVKFGHVLTLIMYLDSTIQQMTEAWEDILLEMDSKLMKLAEEKKKIDSGTVSSDFLRLLMFGTPSDELQSFLLHELTDRGLKKLGHSIETSYSNIQKLVLKHLQSVCQALTFHLADLAGMARCHFKFSELGLSEETVNAAISVAGSFLLKASQLQQVIDGSIKNFKAFFRWLYVVMKGLSDEPVPPELTKMTQQDLNFVAQFLKENFTEEVEGSKSGFKLEKVGQYLKMEDLPDPPDCSANPWLAFLQQNKDVPGSKMFYPPENHKSLLQMHALLKQSIDAALDQCALTGGQCAAGLSTTLLFSVSQLQEDPNLRFSQMSKEVGDTTYIYTAFTAAAAPARCCHLIRQPTTARNDNTELSACSLVCGQLASPDKNSSMDGVSVSSHMFQDVSSYSADTLSVLLVEDAGDLAPVLAQVPLAALESDAFQPVSQWDDILDLDNLRQADVGPLLDGMNHRRLDNMRASQIAVSGTRNVACVLFSSRRRVRLFLMDAGDEDEDDDDDDANTTQNTTHDASNVTHTDDDDDENKENSRESAMEALAMDAL